MQYPERVRRGFSRAATTYDLHAALQREVLEETTSLLLPLLAGEARILDAGCGTGYLARMIKSKPVIPAFRTRPRDKPGVTNSFTILQLDSAEGMCRTAALFAPSVCADIAALPLEDQSVEAVFSSLVLQWMEHPGAAFDEFWRVTTPGGYAAIATLGTETLRELRECFLELGLAPSVLRFAPQAELIGAANSFGWKVEKVASELKCQLYPSFTHLLHQLKGLGATFKERSHLTPGQLKELQALYEKKYRAQGNVTATFEVITLLLRKPA